MKRFVILLVSLFVFLAFQGAMARAASEKVPLTERILVNIDKDGVAFFAGGAMYVIRADCIGLPKTLLYFTAKDFTKNKNFLIKKVEKVEQKVDTPDRKMVKVTMLVGDNKIENDIDQNYRLVLFAEIIKGEDYLVLYSKFLYLGEGTRKCGINWGFSSASDEDPFKYYTLPQKGKDMTYKLSGSKKNKIGYAKWLYVHNGKGMGIGLVSPALLGKGEDFIFINTVPPTKDLKRNESSDVFMVWVPITDGYKVLEKTYEEINKIQWKFE